MAYDLGTAHGKIEIEYNGKGEVDAAERDMERLSRGSKDTDDHLRRLGATLKGFGKGVALTGMAVGLTNAAVGAADLAVQIAGMVPALASLASLSSALPGLYVGAAAAVGVLKASFAGIEDAVTAAFDTKHPEKFDEAIKKLSPSAAAFATAIRDASKGLREYQQGLQESFFSASTLAAQVPKMTGALNALRPQLNGLASDFGNVVRQTADFALSAQSINFVRDSVNTFRTAIANVSPALVPVLTGLRAVGQVGLPLLDQLSAAVGDVGTRFGEWLSYISSNGILQEWINTAIDTLRTLGTIASNVGSIFNSIFQAASASGGGLLNTIAQITGQFRTFLSSAEGQQALLSLFTGIGAAAKALAPVLTTLVGALAGALGPALLQLATEIGPVLLQVVQALAPAFGPLATAIASVIGAVAPLLPPLAQLVAMLVQMGAGVLTTLATNLAPIISLIGAGLTGALTALQPLIEQAIANLPQFADAGIQIANALAPLLPAVIQFATALSSALLPYLPQITQATLQLVPPLVQLATLLADQLSGALLAIIPYLPQIIGFFVGMQGAAMTLLAAGIQLVNFFVRLFAVVQQIPAIIGTALGTFAGFFVNAFNSAKTAVSTGITAIVGFFQALPGRIAGFLAALPGVIAGFISSAMSRAAFLFGQGIGVVISLALSLPRRVGAALAALPGVMRNLVTAAWNAVRAAFSSGVSAATSTARALPGRIRGAISSLGSTITSVARSAWNSFVGAVRSGVSSAAAAARALPGAIRSAVGNLGSLLVGAGRDAVAGLVNGIRSGAGAVASAAASLGASVMAGIKSKLKIFSPSREMVLIGRFVTQGLRNGLLGTAKQVQTAANKLANMVRDAFSDKLIKKGARDSVLGWLSYGTKQLVALVNKSNSVAAKLKSAQSSLAAAQKSYNDQYNEAVKQTRASFQLVTSGQEFVNLDLTKERFQDAVAQARQFANDIATLTKRGLHVHLIEQLAAAGPEAGAAMAHALAGADKATLDQFTLMQKQLNGAANAVGKNTADSLYGAGLSAAKGLVKGLQDQQKAIEKQMVKIANSMVAAIKKALKIKSPSRIMFNLGKFTSEGLADGIEALRRQVQQAAQKLATASIIPTVRLGMAGNATTGTMPYSGGTSGVGGTTNVFNQTVNALPGMSARQVADYSFTKLRYGLTTGVSAAPIPTPLPAGA